jgi:hypothetical protein
MNEKIIKKRRVSTLGCMNGAEKTWLGCAGLGQRAGRYHEIQK